MNITTAVVVEDHRRNEFKSWRAIDKKLNARVGVVGESRAKNVKRYFPNTEVVLLKTYSDFFTDNPKGVDALVISAEAGSAWTILYPAYSVVVPEPHLKANAAFAIPLVTLDFEDFINDWLQMRQTSGIINNLYKKWILGVTTEQITGRWSVGRDLLGWWE
jgi:ABC-type amino acid transport substrate-binding protein